MQEPQFQRFLAAVRTGDQRAAEELVHQFEPALRRVIHRRLSDTRLRRVFDTMDIVQSILGNFFPRAAAGQFKLKNSEDLRKLLVTMAINKLTSKFRKEHNQGGEIPEGYEPKTDIYHPSQTPDNQDFLRVMRGRLAEEDRLLFDLRAKGRTWTEIGKQLRKPADSLRIRLARVIARVKAEIEREELHHDQ